MSAGATCNDSAPTMTKRGRRCQRWHDGHHTYATQAVPGASRSWPVTAGPLDEEMAALAGNEVARRDRAEPQVGVAVALRTASRTVNARPITTTRLSLSSTPTSPDRADA